MKKLFENWRKYLNEDDAAFHGKGMKPTQMRVPQCDTPPDDSQWQAGEEGCPQFSHEYGVGLDSEDIIQAVEFINNVKPSHLFAYSRGGAMAIGAFNKGVKHAPEITFIAPAWKRGFVNGLDPKINVRGVIIHGTVDEFVPLRQSFELSALTGLPLYVSPKADHGGSILKHKSDPTGGALVSKDVLQTGLKLVSDWGSAKNGTAEEVEKQHGVVMEVMGNAVSEQSEPFQREVRAKHRKMKKKLLGTDTGPRSKSAPPGAGGS